MTLIHDEQGRNQITPAPPRIRRMSDGWQRRDSASFPLRMKLSAPTLCTAVTTRSLPSAHSLPIITALLLCCFPTTTRAALASFESESGTLGADWTLNNSGTPTYITVATDGAGNQPGTAARVASYTVTFPEPGLYHLYARLRTGFGAFNDDSMFLASSFGSKSPTSNFDWILVNGLAGAGFNNDAQVVTGGGSVGNGVWKWINLSQFTSHAGFTVGAGSLTQTFQIGARENGLDLDKFAFGNASASFTVADLDSGTASNPPPMTNTFNGPDGIALHRFSPAANGSNAEGANPAAAVIVVDDRVYGTTLNGGVNGAGTVFQMRTDGSNMVAVRSFAAAPDASHSQAALGISGNALFGTSLAGGNNGAGTVFRMETNGSVSVLRHFATIDPHTATNFGGASPSSALVEAGGRFYGTATAGGAAANGTIFSVATNGTGFSVLRNFSGLDAQSGTNTDGAIPAGGLIADGGVLYGTTAAGGPGGSGTVFSIRTNGADFTTLHGFSAPDPATLTNIDGAMPCGRLVLSDGTLYGTTFSGGHGGRGTLFSMQTNGNDFTVLHHFSALDPESRTNSGGASPGAGLTLSGNVLYGTAPLGGPGGAGTIFSFHLNSTQFTKLHAFAAVSSNGTNAHGAFPVAPVVRAGSALFGTAFSGGPGGSGTVFRIPLAANPAVITNVMLQTNGTFTVHFTGDADSTNVIQSTTSLNPPVTWQNVSTNVANADGAWDFAETNDGAVRFYRSFTQ